MTRRLRPRSSLDCFDVVPLCCTSDTALVDADDLLTNAQRSAGCRFQLRFACPLFGHALKVEKHRGSARKSKFDYVHEER